MRRLAWVVVVFSAALLVVAWYAKGRQAEREARAAQPAVAQAQADTQPAPATAPADAAAPAPAPGDTPAPAPAGADSRPASEPAASLARADATALQANPWRIASGTPGQKYVIGELVSPRQAEGAVPFQVELIGDGAAIQTVKLNGYFFTVDDKRLADSDWPEYEKSRLADPVKYQGPYSLMNPVSHEGRRYLPLATRKVTVHFPNAWPWTLAAGFKAPDKDPEGMISWSWTLDDVPWVLEKQSAGGVSLSWTLHLAVPGEAKPRPVVRLVKSYTVARKDYMIGVSVRAENLSGQTLRIALDQAGPCGVPREDIRDDMRKVAYGRYVAQDDKVRGQLKEGRKKLQDAKPGQEQALGSSADPEPVLWVGYANKFFGAMMYLEPEPAKTLQAPGWDARFYMADAMENSASCVEITGLRIPRISLDAGQSADVRFRLFAGPKRREMFVDTNSAHFDPLYQRLDYVSTIDLGSCFLSWDWLSLMMIVLLQWFSVATLGNYGLAIILLVILVRLLLHPLTKKSQVSMMKMKKMGPLMKELEKKYADDKETLSREKMKIIKEQGATPIMGCLPILLQMPILIALWTGINASIDLRHAAFLPFWITDLAAPDSVWSWHKDLPYIGTGLNLLPILLGGAMYWQMKLTPQQPATSPEQEKQQKMMAVMMPLMMPLLFYTAASGLTLYFMASTFFGAVEQHVIRKHIEAKEAAVAAAETTVHVPGKAARGSRPKKPRGPLWIKKG